MGAKFPGQQCQQGGLEREASDGPEAGEHKTERAELQHLKLLLVQFSNQFGVDPFLNLVNKLFITYEIEVH